MTLDMDKMTPRELIEMAKMMARNLNELFDIVANLQDRILQLELKIFNEESK